MSATPNFNPFTQPSLGADQFLNFLVDPTPFILDPESFLATFPDSNLFEVSELIYQYSLEAQNMTIGVPGPLPSDLSTLDPMQMQTVYDFVEASVNCALSRIYDISGGADSSTITLGDLTITNRYTEKASVNRSNATTWCELAGVIRNELFAIGKRSGMRAVLKGSNYFNPIPPRQIQHIEWRSWGDYSSDPGVGRQP